MLSFFRKMQLWWKADRIGPDIPINHWLLHFEQSMRHLCQNKFKFFHHTASFRHGAYAICCSKISIGAYVTIRPGTMLFADPREDGAGITIEDNVLIGSGVHMYVHNHRFENTFLPISKQGWYPSKSILIKEGSWIGANALILPGVTIGKNAVVGAGSVVTKQVPDYAVVVGAPARVVKVLG